MVIQFIVLIASFIITLVMAFFNGRLWEARRRMKINLEILKEIRRDLTTPEDFEKLEDAEKDKLIEKMWIRRGKMEMLEQQELRLGNWKL